MNPVWAVGDLCLHATNGGASHQLGLVEKVNVNRNVCTVTQLRSQSKRRAKPDELLSITRNTIQLADIDKSDLLPQVDVEFFGQKLDKLCGILSENAPATIPRAEPSAPYKAPNTNEWTLGKMCICLWNEDEGHYYATIVEANPSEDRYLVRFCYYDNTEVKTAAELHPVGSEFQLLVEDEANSEAAILLQKRMSSRRSTPLVVGTGVDERVVSKPESSVRFDSNAIDTPVEANADLPSDVDSASVSYTAPTEASRRSVGEFRPPWDVAPQPPHTLPSGLAHLRSGNDSRAPWQALLISWFMCGYHTGYFEALHSGPDRSTERD